MSDPNQWDDPKPCSVPGCKYAANPHSDICQMHFEQLMSWIVRQEAKRRIYGNPAPARVQADPEPGADIAASADDTVSVSG